MQEMLRVTAFMIATQREARTIENTDIFERAGLDLLHNLALRWTLPPGARKETILIT